MEFGEADEAGIGEGHGLVAVAVHELAQRGEFALDGEGDVEHAAFDQGQQRVGVAAVAAQDVRGFGKDGFAGEQRRAECRHRLARPAMMLRLPDEEGDERPGVGDDDLSHWPKSSRYFGFVAMSRGPLRQPAKSSARSRHVAARSFLGASITLSRHSRITADLDVRRRRASSANRESSVSGTFNEIVVMCGEYYTRRIVAIPEV